VLIHEFLLLRGRWGESSPSQLRSGAWGAKRMIYLLGLLIDGGGDGLLHHLLLLLQLRRLNGEGGGSSLASGDVHRHLVRAQAVGRRDVTRIVGGRIVKRCLGHLR
jgi:hypothetical protein